MHALKYLSCAAALVLVLAPVATAQDSAEAKRLTLLTFSQPVQLPGRTLPAGTYRFEMADINNASHTVRVLSEDGQKVFGTFSTMSSTLPQRDLQDQDTLIMFAERPAGQPQAARVWFYPGRSIGEEFIYPKDQAQAIANANNTSVAATEDGKIVRVEPESRAANEPAPAPAAPATAGREQARQDNQAQPASPEARTPAAVGTAGQTTAPPASPASQAQGDQPARTLPRTASNLHVLQILSGLALVAGLGVRRVRLATSARR